MTDPALITDAPATNAARSDRRYYSGFDVLRLMGAYAVVWIHSSDVNPFAKQLQDYASFAVPCFLLMGIWLTLDGLQRRRESILPTILRRCWRLLPAYLGWSLIYVAVRSFKSWAIKKPLPHFDWSSIIFAGGASYQLYYVPMLLLFLTVAILIVLCFPLQRFPKMSVVIFIALGIVAIAFPVTVTASPGWELWRYCAGNIGFLPLGIAIWTSFRTWRSLRSPTKITCWTIAVLWLISIGMLSFSRFDHRTTAILFALLTFLMALMFEVRGPEWLRSGAEVSFGIYLAHPLFVEGLQFAGTFLKFKKYSLGAVVLMTVVAFLASWFLCALMRRSRATRWLVE